MKRCLSSAILVLILASLALSCALAGGSASAATGAPPDGVFVVRIYYDAPDDIGRLAAFDLFEYNNLEQQYVLAAVDRAELTSLHGLGFRTAIDPEETANFARLATPLAQQPGFSGVESIPRYDCYRTVEETYAAAQALATAHPNLATWIDVGDSWEKSVGQPDGYDMMVLKLTNTAITGDKPKLFATASIHAREYTPAELATRFAEYLVNNYGVDADATWILDHHEVHLLLQANPDGRKEAEAGRSWRKNTNEKYCGATSTNRGADLNRNFSAYWNYCSGCSSGIPCDATYRGPTPASEPETQAIESYILNIFPDQRADGLTSPAPPDAAGVYIDLHSYSQLVLWPWGMTTTDAPNGTALQTLGRKFAYFNSYTPQQSYDLYGTDGSTIDFAYSKQGVAAYTFELGTAFFQSCSTFEGTVYPGNLPALIYAAKVSRTPYQAPLGPDALDLSLVPAPVAGGQATLTATINDTRYRSGTGEPTQAIAAAEYYVDTPPWQAGAVARAMAASDGSFSSTTENVTAALDTSGLAPGRHIVFLRGQDAGGNWGAFSAIFLAGPLAVNLAGFGAEATADGVALAWETISETGVAGFNIYRATSSEGPWTQLNDALIPAQAPGAAAGGSYTFTDTTAPQGATLWYQLEDVALDGATTRHDPVSVTPAGAPNVVSLSALGASAPAGWSALAGLASVAGLAAAGFARRRK